MNYFEIIVPIAVGALIGYCTNYIAIKMLFRPRREIRVFGKRLPFTPGVIPKNKPRVAKACGKAVSDNLLTGDDIRSIILGEDVKKRIATTVVNTLYSEEITLGDFVHKIDQSEGESFEIRASVMLTDKIKAAATEIDYSDVIGKIASQALMEKFAGTMFSMFLNESTISMLAEPIGDSIKEYIENQGEEFIYPVVKKNIEETKEIKPKDILEKLELDKEIIEENIGEFYISIMEKYSEDIIRYIDVEALVERKINEMNDEMLEDLVMSVMKNELQAVINLGALIGAIIGIINVFVL